jgi:hypothetical protein
MEIDKIELVQNSLRMMLKHTEDKVKENEEKLKEKEGADDEEVSEEFVALGMYGTYLLGVQKTLEMVIELLDNDTLDQVIEKIEKMQEDIAKA